MTFHGHLGPAAYNRKLAKSLADEIDFLHSEKYRMPRLIAVAVVPFKAVRILVPEKYRNPWAWVMRLARVYAADGSELKHLLSSLEMKLSRGDQTIVLSEEQLQSMYAPVANTIPAFPKETEEEERKRGLVVCQMLMERLTLESMRDQTELAPKKGEFEFEFQKP